MEALNFTAQHALRVLLEGQPTSPEKVAFAFRMVAGASLARAAEPNRRDGVLIVRAKTDAWRRELRHARPILTTRLQALVGADVVKKIVIEWGGFMREAVIFPAVRTPTGKFLGGLKDFKATELGAMAVREVVRRAGIDAAS